MRKDGGGQRKEEKCKRKRKMNILNRYRTAINYLRICARSAVCAINYLLRTALFRAYMRGVWQWWLA